MQPKITPYLWFDDQAEEAVDFYLSVFDDARVVGKSYWGKSGGPEREGTVLTVEFELAGQRLVLLNGGPMFTLSEAISLQVDCESQQEVDYYWEKLLADGGTEGPCGWLKDKYGLSWQITPRRLLELVSDPDRDKADRVMQAMYQMKKIDLQAIEDAATAA